MNLNPSKIRFSKKNIINYLFRRSLEEKLKIYKAKSGSIEDEVRNYCLDLIASGKYDESRNELEFLYDYYGRKKIKFEALGPIIERVKKNIGWNNNSKTSNFHNLKKLPVGSFPEDFNHNSVSKPKKPYRTKSQASCKAQPNSQAEKIYVKSLDDFFEKNSELKEIRDKLETQIFNIKPETLQERYKLIQVSLETTDVLEYIRSMGDGHNFSNPVVVIKNLLKIETFKLESILDKLHKASIPIKLFPPGILYQSGKNLERLIEKYENNRFLQ